MFHPEVERFLKSSIRSVWDLELLLFMQAERARSWTAEELVRALRGSMLIVSDALLGLTAAGLIGEEEARYRYRPATPELDRLVEMLRETYASYPAAVTNMIWSTPRATIQIFADAFKIKKD